MCEIHGQELDRDLATKPGVARPIDLALPLRRPAVPDIARADSTSRLAPVIRRFRRLHAAEQRSIHLGQRRFHSSCARVTVAGLCERPPLVRRTLARFVKELLDTAPVLPPEPPPSLVQSRACSPGPRLCRHLALQQALANVQSDHGLADTSRTAAVSRR